jgi:hypothetical protein
VTLSESARANSAAETRFRVQAVNSLPRAIVVVALDADAAAVVSRLADDGGVHAAFFTAAEDATLTAPDGTVRSIADAIGAADLVVLVAGPGGRAGAAPLLGEACSRRRIMTTGFIVGAASAPERELAKTLGQIRPWSLMVVVSKTDDYIDDMMSALGA